MGRKKEDDPATPYVDNEYKSPKENLLGFVRVRLRVDYNNWSNDIDRIALVVYAQDTVEVLDIFE